MKKFVLIYTMLFLFGIVSAQKQIPNDVWSVGTAKTIPERQVQLSLFYFSKYGITKNVELQSKPLWYFKIPNFNVKIKWYEKPGKPNKKFYKRLGIVAGSLHGIYYPTPAMKYIQRHNLQNIDFDGSPIPKSLVFRNEFLLTLINNKSKGCYVKNTYYTFKIGTAFALKDQDYRPLETKNAFWYRKTSVFDNKFLWYLGFDYDSEFSYGLHYAFDIDFYSIGLRTENYAIEHKGLFYTLWLTHLRVAAGYKIAYTNRTGIKPAIYPLFDFTVIFYTKKKFRNDQLFENQKRKRKNKYKNLYDDEKPKEKDEKDDGDDKDDVEDE